MPAQEMPFTVALIAALIKILLTVGFIMLAVPMLVWLERKLIADFQARIGPQRVGPYGLLQSFADGLKLLSKEALQPAQVDRLLYYAAPVVVLMPAISVAAVVPFAGDLRIGEYVHRMVIADLPIGILFVLALTSLSVYGIVLSGWASTNKYSLLGGLRSSAQMVSYELPMGFSLVAGLMIASHATPGGLFSLSLRQVVETQEGWFWNWVAFRPQFIFLGFLALITFYICGLAETNRAPFDLPEAESELVAGYLTEYGGMKWAMFFLGEYAAMLNVSAVATTVFLGGWHSPYPDRFLGYGSPLYMLHGLFWFGLKIFAIIVIYIWLRATLPRLRYDQLMTFSWKGLLPTTLANVLLVATILTIGYREQPPAVLQESLNRPTPTGEAAPPGGLPGGLMAPGGAPAPAGPGVAPGGGGAGMGAPGDTPGTSPSGSPGPAPGAAAPSPSGPGGGSSPAGPPLPPSAAPSRTGPSGGTPSAPAGGGSR